MRNLVWVLAPLVAVVALAKEPGAKLSSKDLAGGWSVKLELDYSSCAPGWGKPGDVAEEKWNAKLDTDGQLQISIAGEGSAIDANNTGYTAAVEGVSLLLSSTSGHNTKLKLRGTPKQLSGTCLTAIATSSVGGPDKGACAMLYSVTAKKQN
jgi:hypothetical protein